MAAKGAGGAMATTLTAAIISLCLTIFFGLLCFIRFLRARSIAGGLFLTTAMSTAAFLGTSQFIGVLIPPTAAAFTAEPGAVAAGIDVIIILAQIGLFAVWFGFLLFTIHIHVSPIRRVNHYLEQILEGEQVKRIRLGRSRQYREIAQNLRELSARTTGKLCPTEELTEDGKTE